MWRRLFVIGLGMAALACVRAEITKTGRSYPPREEGCPVQVLPSTLPNYNYEEIATGEVQCHMTHGRTACIDRLKAEACKLGAHAVFGFREGKAGEAHVITASFARWNGPKEPEPAGPQPELDPGDDDQRPRRKKVVKTEPSEAGAEVAASSEPEQRLKKLETLREEGLITDEEYAERRRAILDSL